MADEIRNEIRIEIRIMPIGHQDAAQHPRRRTCDGFHEPGQCKDDQILVDVDVHRG